MTPEQYRRVTGIDLIAAERRLQKAVRSQQEKPVEQRKQQDEQRQQGAAGRHQDFGDS